MKPVAIAASGAVLGMALAFSSTATADFTHAEILDVSSEVNTPPGLRTWRVYVVFTEATDQVLAVSGQPEFPLVFETDDPQGLFNDGGAFAGHKNEDFANFPITAEYDSWVTIRADMFSPNDTDYSPGFLDNDGVTRVIVGDRWTDDNDGWFDS